LIVIDKYNRLLYQKNKNEDRTTYMELEIVIGHNFQKHIDTVANLRISIFREYPYLYDGNISYEADYLKSYVLSKNSILILARDKGQIVGALTGLPLLEADEMFRIVFEKKSFSN